MLQAQQYPLDDSKYCCYPHASLPCCACRACVTHISQYRHSTRRIPCESHCCSWMQKAFRGVQSSSRHFSPFLRITFQYLQHKDISFIKAKRLSGHRTMDMDHTATLSSSPPSGRENIRPETSTVTSQACRAIIDQKVCRFLLSKGSSFCQWPITASH